jgi:hypothetical protein
MDANEHACHPFRLVGDTLILGQVADPSFFRRVRLDSQRDRPPSER